MQYEYQTVKTKFSGWKASTRIELGPCELDGKPAKRVLIIDTSKNKKGGTISTFANVSMVQKETFEGREYERMVTAVFSDFAKYVQHEPAKTITEKAVKTAHEKAMGLFDSIKKEAIAFYN